MRMSEDVRKGRIINVLNFRSFTVESGDYYIVVRFKAEQVKELRKEFSVTNAYELIGKEVNVCLQTKRIFNARKENEGGVVFCSSDLI